MYLNLQAVYIGTISVIMIHLSLLSKSNWKFWTEKIKREIERVTGYLNTNTQNVSINMYRKKIIMEKLAVKILRHTCVLTSEDVHSTV